MFYSCKNSNVSIIRDEESYSFLRENQKVSLLTFDFFNPKRFYNRKRFIE